MVGSASISGTEDKTTPFTLPRLPDLISSPTTPTPAAPSHNPPPHPATTPSTSTTSSAWPRLSERESVCCLSTPRLQCYRGVCWGGRKRQLASSTVPRPVFSWPPTSRHHRQPHQQLQQQQQLDTYTVSLPRMVNILRE